MKTAHRIALPLAVLVGGCAQNVELEPAPRAEMLPQGGAVNSVAGIEAQVQADAWPGPAPIGKELVPARITVENRSSKPVRIAYEHFALVGPGGNTYAALPPYRITGTVAEPTLGPGYGPVAEPGFVGSGFGVAPYYSPVYPGYAVAPDPFYSDRLYNDYYYDRWARYDLPTDAMRARALPEGVLDPGGELSGFLYFEEIDPEIPRVTFRMDLVNASTGDRMGTLSIPFVVED